MGANRDEQGRFPPGISGNPKGRPRRIPKWVAEIRRNEGEYWKELHRLALESENDRTRLEAIKELLAYSRGKPKQGVELTGKDGGPIQSEGAAIVDATDLHAVLEHLAGVGAPPADAKP